MDIDILFGRILFGIIGVAFISVVIWFIIERIRDTKKSIFGNTFSRIDAFDYEVLSDEKAM